jgi:hypothetical protein
MANLAAANVSLFPSSLAEAEDYTAMKGVYYRRLKLNLAAMGTAGNQIGAAALGFKKLLNCGPLWDSVGAKVIPAVVDPVNNVILLGAPASGTPTDLTTASGYITVWGT